MREPRQGGNYELFELRALSVHQLPFTQSTATPRKGNDDNAAVGNA